MSAITDLMDQIADTLETATNIADDWPVQVTGRRNFNPTPPSIDIYPADPFRTLDTAGFGDVSGSIFFTVRARVSASDNLAEREILYSFMDDEHDRCVAAALLEDPTLNGWAQDLDVEGPSGERIYQDIAGQQAFLGCEWQVRVVNAPS